MVTFPGLRAKDWSRPYLLALGASLAKDLVNRSSGLFKSPCPGCAACIVQALSSEASVSCRLSGDWAP